ncbi:hypothetical protein [Streptomyces sp. NPDC058280]|uniref:hypothetical protein n=1 Tax=Streptomyces sp. NPDC058280 TaxID=3346419 RepID=UPI0036E3B7B7
MASAEAGTVRRGLNPYRPPPALFGALLGIVTTAEIPHRHPVRPAARPVLDRQLPRRTRLRLPLLARLHHPTLLISSSAFLAGWLPLLTLPGPHAATAAVVAPGAFFTVAVACAYMSTDAFTPTGRTSEAYAWLILSIGVGQAAGTALAGRLADHALAALPAATFALTVLLLARRGRNRREPA